MYRKGVHVYNVWGSVWGRGCILPTSMHTTTHMSHTHTYTTTHTHPYIHPPPPPTHIHPQTPPKHTCRLSNTSGNTASSKLLYLVAFLTGAVLLCSMSDTQNRCATLVGRGVPMTHSAAVMVFTTWGVWWWWWGEGGWGRERSRDHVENTLQNTHSHTHKQHTSDAACA